MQTFRQSNTDITDQTHPAVIETSAPSVLSLATEVPGIASLKLLAITLLKQIENLEGQLTVGLDPTHSLRTQVLRFEANLIRSALVRTGGRQRSAARLLGVKVTTLNSKIKRLRINVEADCRRPADANADIEIGSSFQA